MLLEVRHLVSAFDTPGGVLRAVDDVSFTIDEGEAVGMVGESGCGKSVTALSILRLLPQRTARILQGEILFRGQNLLTLDAQAMRKIRGKEIAMIFQDPMTSLNPVFRVGEQIMEAILLHQRVDKRQARQRALEAMEQVGIPDAQRRMDDYPHQFSGGQRQRIMIAMALSCKPALLIADEPTTALDVTIQAQILDLLRMLARDLKMSLLLISHDLAVISEVTQRVLLMYAGRIVEAAAVDPLFRTPRHPYAHGLLSCLPRLKEAPPEGYLPTIAGSVPDLRHLPSGCRFSNRCNLRVERCELQEPPLLDVGPQHTSACWEWKRV